MKSKPSLFAAVIIAALASSVSAQEKRSEMTFNGDLSSTKVSGAADATESTRIGIGYGFYMTSQLVGSFSYDLNYDYTPGSGATPWQENSSNILGLGVKYYFTPVGNKGAWVPFVAAGFASINNKSATGLAGSSRSDNGSGSNLEVGAAMFLTESASLDLKLYSLSFSIAGASITQSGLKAGFTVRF